MSAPKTHLIIPARLKSTRLPNKPLLPIHGKPMILWTAQKAARATQAGIADDYYVATDHADIFELCCEHEVPVVVTANHHPSGTDRLAEVARQLDFADHDIILNLQGDEPLVPSAILAQLKQLLIDKSDCAMATLCEPIDSYEDFVASSVVKVVMANHEALYFSRSPIPHDRDNPTAFAHAYRHLGLYAYRVFALKAFASWQMGALERLESLEQLRILENHHKIAIDVIGVQLPLGVDTQADLDRLNAMSLSRLAEYDG